MTPADEQAALEAIRKAVDWFGPPRARAKRILSVLRDLGWGPRPVVDGAAVDRAILAHDRQAFGSWQRLIEGPALERVRKRMRAALLAALEAPNGD